MTIDAIEEGILSTPQWFAEFERDEARRQDRLEVR
jgi:hypothetical protein